MEFGKILLWIKKVGGEYGTLLVVLCVLTLSSYYLFWMRRKRAYTDIGASVQTLKNNAHKGKDNMVIRDIWIYPLKSGHRCSVKVRRALDLSLLDACICSCCFDSFLFYSPFLCTIITTTKTVNFFPGRLYRIEV